MLTFLTTVEHNYTVTGYRNLWGASLRQGVRCLSYELLFCVGSVPNGAYIFTDLDRLPPASLERAGRWFQTMRDHGAAVLNDPRRQLGRRDLLQKFHRDGRNRFNAYRLDERHLARFPVFLRFDSGHGGPESDLIDDAASLEREVALATKGKSRRELIVVEYLDHTEADGRHYKYSHFRIGSRLVFSGMVCGKSWCLKAVEDINDEIVGRELRDSLNHEHDEDLMSCFDAAGVEFGRIDYASIRDQHQSRSRRCLSAGTTTVAGSQSLLSGNQRKPVEFTSDLTGTARDQNAGHGQAGFPPSPFGHAAMAMDPPTYENEYIQTATVAGYFAA